MKGHQNMIAQLVNLGADPDERVDHQRTALHIASELPCEDVVERERRASTTGSVRPVGLRFSYAFHESMEPRRRSQGSTTSAYDDCSSIEALIRAGADKDCVDMNGDSALHLAVRAGIETNVRILVEQGVAINARNTAGQTPLDVMAAGSRQDPSISSFLLSCGAILAPSEASSEGRRRSSWLDRSI
jgi:ankyrin repeat protein